MAIRSTPAGRYPPGGDCTGLHAGRQLFDVIPPVEKGGARLIVRILGDPADEMRSWTDSAEDAVRDRCLAAFARALPDLSADELWFRVRGILAVTAVDRVDFYNQPCFGETIRERCEESRCWAITFRTAALSAPPSGSEAETASRRRLVS